MRRSIRRLAAGVVLAVVVAAGAAPAGADRVPLHQVPKPVQDAVRARFPDARITGADRDLEAGVVLYEVSLRQAGQNIDVVATPEGALVLIKREIAPGEVAGPVARALEARFPGATYKVVEEVTRVDGRRETLAHYEVLLVTARRRTLEVLIGVDGAILRQER
jgi:hypothetical protein